MYATHHETLEGWYDPKVIELYEALQNQVEKFEHTLPEHGAEERKVVAAAKDRYRLMYKKIWPKIRELVEEDLANEKVKQMLNQRQENEAIQNALEQINKEALEELRKLLEAMEGKGGADKDEDKGEHTHLIPIENSAEAIWEFVQGHYRGIVRNAGSRQNSERFLLHPGALALVAYMGGKVSDLAKLYREGEW